MRTKRKDKDREPKNQRLEEKAVQSEVSGGLGKNFLLFVEGETEEAYFEKLKQNPWLNNNLAGVTIQRNVSFKSAHEKANNPENRAKQVWLVTDNDKRNAFILEQNKKPFFQQLSDNYLPTKICSQLQDAYDPDKHNYFLSIYDYLQWLRRAIDINDIVKYWDSIYFSTEKKREFDEYYNPKNAEKESNYKLKLAYSCIAFEFWLILHFEQNNMPFLWVDKEKAKEIDVATYFRTLKPGYEKGYFDQKNKKEKLCHAYNCLYPNQEKSPQTKDDEWQVLMCIFKAIQNTDWLREQMKPTLDRQCGKWYEVNPYIQGMNKLMKELLNIKPLGQPLEYFGLSVQFGFNTQNSQLSLHVAVDDGNAFSFGAEKARCFEIKNGKGQSFLPKIEQKIDLPNDYAPLIFHYDIQNSTDNQLILIFKDPRDGTRSSQLFFLLT